MTELSGKLKGKGTRDFSGYVVQVDNGIARLRDALARTAKAARDIVAERIVETPQWRAAIRDLTWKEGMVHSRAARGKKDTVSKFSNYYDHQEPLKRIAVHRVHALVPVQDAECVVLRLVVLLQLHPAVLVPGSCHSRAVAGQAGAQLADLVQRLLLRDLEHDPAQRRVDPADDVVAGTAVNRHGPAAGVDQIVAASALQGVGGSVTRERIRQIEAKALGKLRHPADIAGVDDFCHDGQAGFSARG